MIQTGSQASVLIVFSSFFVQGILHSTASERACTWDFFSFGELGSGLKEVWVSYANAAGMMGHRYDGTQL